MNNVKISFLDICFIFYIPLHFVQDEFCCNLCWFSHSSCLKSYLAESQHRKKKLTMQKIMYNLKRINGFIFMNFYSESCQSETI